jgi:hypothetical protein
LNPLIYGAKTSDVTLFAALQGRPPKGEVGRCPALRLIPGKGAAMVPPRHNPL